MIEVAGGSRAVAPKWLMTILSNMREFLLFFLAVGIWALGRDLDLREEIVLKAGYMALKLEFSP